MCRADIKKIEQFLEEKLGETKGLSEWRYEINKDIVSHKKLTDKELAYIFNRTLNNKFIIERHLVHYTFFR